MKKLNEFYAVYLTFTDGIREPVLCKKLSGAKQLIQNAFKTLGFVSLEVKKVGVKWNK